MSEEVLELINSNTKMIYSIARKYSNYYNLQDLFQVGVIGIMKANSNYNENTNAKFSSYAYKYIKGEIINYVKNDRMIKVSDNDLKIYNAYTKTREFLYQKTNHEPTYKEISEFMGIDEEKLMESINNVQFTVSFEASISEDGNVSYLDTLGFDPSNQLDNLIDLKEALSKLSNEEKHLIDCRYYQGLSQCETADVLGMSQVQVSRNEKLVLSKIKKSIAA